jgi:general L-amino acid transport system permease protein
VVLAMVAIASYAGLVAGHVRRRQLAAGRAEGAASVGGRVRDLVARLWPALVGILVLLLLTTTIAPTLVVAGVVAAALAGRLIGRALEPRWLLPLAVTGVVGSVVLAWLLTRPIGWDEWGGLMLNVVLAAAGIGLSFPLGVLLALGRQAGRRTESVAGGIVVAVLLAGPLLVLLVRRGFAADDAVAWALLAAAALFAAGGYRIGFAASLPLVRVVSIGYIEFFRGVPLYVLLGLGYLGLGFFLPSGVEPPGLVIRATVVFVLFTAAYVAEIVRGGLQSLPRGQTEASQALGLSPVRMTLLVVLPQALRAVIPALVGQFISLFKDTTLAGAAIGFLEVLNVSTAVTAQDEFRGQALTGETVTFMMFLFWVGCITMSRESQRLERKLGVGTR